MKSAEEWAAGLAFRANGSDAWSIYMWEFPKIRGSFKGILKGSLKGSIRVLGFRVSEN